jgi:hypothetical protein
MGEVIDLARYRIPRPGRPPEAPCAPAREGICESCTSRRAVAEVFRSDAVDSGLGGRLQCGRCLAAELRAGRCGPDARRAEARLAWLLRGRERSLRIELEWDVHFERAIALDGMPLD